jgi:hypothetical protein
MTRPRILEVEVEGRGPFPIDMLRYDGCYPVREAEDSYHGVGLREPECYEGVRRVRLYTVRERLTVDRWRSFGWKVVAGPYAPGEEKKAPPMGRTTVEQVIEVVSEVLGHRFDPEAPSHVQKRVALRDRLAAILGGS